VCINSLRLEAASVAVTPCLLTAFLRDTESLHLLLETQPPNAESKRKDGEKTQPEILPENHRVGELPAGAGQWLSPLSAGLGRILAEHPRRSRAFDNIFSSVPATRQKSNAFCSECLVATHPYLIPLILPLLSFPPTWPELPQATHSHPQDPTAPQTHPVP